MSCGCRSHPCIIHSVANPKSSAVFLSAQMDSTCGRKSRQRRRWSSPRQMFSDQTLSSANCQHHCSNLNRSWRFWRNRNNPNVQSLQRSNQALSPPPRPPAEKHRLVILLLKPLPRPAGRIRLTAPYMKVHRKRKLMRNLQSLKMTFVSSRGGRFGMTRTPLVRRRLLWPLLVAR